MRGLIRGKKAERLGKQKKWEKNAKKKNEEKKKGKEVEIKINSEIKKKNVKELTIFFVDFRGQVRQNKGWGFREQIKIKSGKIYQMKGNWKGYWYQMHTNIKALKYLLFSFSPTKG